MSDESEGLYRFKRELVNCVVEKQNASECRESLIPLINSVAEENYDSEKETEDKVKKISSDIFKSNREFNTNIPHKYPPELLLEWREYIDIYGYYNNKDYEFMHTREKVTDDSSFAEKGEYINVISSCQAPVTIVRPYAKNHLNVSKKTEIIEVPSRAYSKDLTPKVFHVENPLDMKKAIIMEMAHHTDINDVEMTKQLTFSINVLESISQDDLELIMSRIRSQVSLAQMVNSKSLQIIASTEDEINHAFDFHKLSAPIYGERELIMSAKNPEIPDFRVALKYLAGLSLMQKTSLMFHKSSGHYTWNKRKDIIISTEVDILRLEINKAFVAKKSNETSVDEIKNNYINEGYKQVLGGVKHHLESFQHKRVQFDVTLNTDQRLALKGAPEISLDDLHYNDIELAKQKIIVHKKQGRNASVRVRKNGSYVITW